MSWDGAPTKWRPVIEEESFTRAVDQLGGAETIDRALDAVYAVLSQAPELPGAITGSWGSVRMIKTERIFWSGRLIYPLRIWYRYDQLAETVHLLWVEEWIRPRA